MFQIIKRHHILKLMWFCIFTFAFSGDLVFGNESTVQKSVVFTFDDLPIAGPDEPVAKIELMTKKLLTGLKAHQIPAIGFINEKLLYRFGEIDKRIAILRMWLQRGFELGNHTYSHPSLNAVGLSAYEDDVIRGDIITKKIMDEMDLKPRYFRHPFLETGLTSDIKHSLDIFLTEHRYKVAPVTIETFDWIFNLLYVNAKNKNDTDKMSEIGQKYLNFASAIIDFFEGFSDSILGYKVKQILLLHANELNADYIDALAQLFEKKNYKFISIDEALQDKAYSLPDKCIKPDNQTWIYRWACTMGKDMNDSKKPKLPSDIATEFEAVISKEADTSRYGNFR